MNFAFMLSPKEELFFLARPVSDAATDPRRFEAKP
jgi:hypothetical protein